MKNLGKEEIIRSGFDAAMVNDVVNKINFSEYKRRQAAPGLENFAARLRHGPAHPGGAKIPGYGVFLDFSIAVNSTAN